MKTYAQASAAAPGAQHELDKPGSNATAQPESVIKAGTPAENPARSGHSVSRIPIQANHTDKSLAPGNGLRHDMPEDNHTGLPDDLKAGIENLSGFSLGDVRVHFNSAKPAQLQALAYTHGTEIDVRPGQAEHLPHEAWHVVQQKQGRVKPTFQAEGKPVNHEAALEHEAEVMGSRALALGGWGRPALHYKAVTAPVVQGFFEVKATDFKTFVAEQQNKQTQVKAGQAKTGEEMFTTVGFEHEFAQMTDGPLQGVTHLELAKSQEKMPYKGLPFVLETDAQNAVELVSPPFLVRTLKDKPIPDADDIHKINNLIKARLGAMTDANPTLGQLVKDFAQDPQIRFGLKDVKVKPMNMTPKTREALSKKTGTIKEASLSAINLTTSEKGGDTHVNFATDAETFDLMQQINPSKEIQDDYTRALTEVESTLRTLLFQSGLGDKGKQSDGEKTAPAGVATAIKQVMDVLDKLLFKFDLRFSPQMSDTSLHSKFYDTLKFHIGPLESSRARLVRISNELGQTYLSRLDIIAGNIEAVIVQAESSVQGVVKVFGEGHKFLGALPDEFEEAVKKVRATLAGLGGSKEEQPNLKTFLNVMARTLSGQLAVTPSKVVGAAQKKRYKKGTSMQGIRYEQMMTSRVKDVKGVWIKDSLMNIGLGLLAPAEWQKILDLVQDKTLISGIKNMKLPELPQSKQIPADDFTAPVLAALDQIAKDIKSKKLTDPQTNPAQVFIGPKEQPGFMSHAAKWIGARQDTYIPAKKVQMPDVWKDKRLHVVESRSDSVTTLRRLQALNQPPKMERLTRLSGCRWSEVGL